jgi:acyl carrier protein
MEKLQKITREAFNLNPAFPLQPTTRLKELPGWDSLSSVNLEIAIEMAYNVDCARFTLGDEVTLAKLLAQLP